MDTTHYVCEWANSDTGMIIVHKSKYDEWENKLQILFIGDYSECLKYSTNQNQPVGGGEK